MEHGGRRPGAGRPTKAQAAERARQDAEAIASRPKISPADYLMGILHSAGSSKSQKLRAAEVLMRRPADVPSTYGAETSPTIILSVPRGSRVDLKTGICTTPDGEVAEMLPFTPYEPTPPLSDRREQRREPPLPFEVCEAEVPTNLVRLDPYRRRDDDDSGPDAA
jgi:hypothetical protein